MTPNQLMWDFEETALLVAEYHRVKNLDPKERGKSVAFISELLRSRRKKKRNDEFDATFRNEKGIHLKMYNLEPLDPDSSVEVQNRKRRCSFIDETVMEIYNENPHKIIKEAITCILLYSDQSDDKVLMHIESYFNK